MAHKHLWVAFLQPQSAEDPSFIVRTTEHRMWVELERYAQDHAREFHRAPPLMELSVIMRVQEYFDRLDSPMLWWDREPFPQE